jgi:hypothetical protein
LVGLAIAIRREFTRDISTAWYVVALIPKTVVAGQGVRIWLQLPVLLAVLLTVPVALIAIAGRPNLGPLIGVTGLVFIAILLVRVLRTTLGRQRPMYSPWPAWPAGYLVVGGAIAGLVGTIMVSRGLQMVFLTVLTVLTAIDTDNLVSVVTSDLGHNLVVSVVSGSSGRNLLVGATLFIVGGFLVAVFGALVVSAPLPPVRINRRNGGACLDGHLVAHADGFWYLMIRDDDKQKELYTIPDTEVLEVRTIAEASIGCTEAAALPEAGSEDDTKPGAEKAK